MSSPGEVVLGEQLAHLQLHQLEQLLVVDHVDLVEEDDDVGHVDLAGEQDVLPGLRHGTVRRGHDQDRSVHLGGAGNHVLHVVGVARAVHVGVVTVRRLVLDVRRGDRNAALPLLRSLVDLVESNRVATELLGLREGDRCGERRLPVVNVPDGADVHVRLCPVELLLCHFSATSLRSVQVNGGVRTPEAPASSGRDLNPGPLPYQGSALPLSYQSAAPSCFGVESGRRDSNPRPSAWKADALAN